MANVAVVYYSSTGNVYELARAVVDGAESAGAEVRFRRARELAPEEAIQSNEAWAKHVEETKDVPVAQSEDLEWADAFAFGTPTRYGNVSAQLKQFIDAQGGLWAQGLLADKAASVFTSASTPHGGQEGTLLSMYAIFAHWGSIIVPTGYTSDEINAIGNPYGVSSTDGGVTGNGGPSKEELAAARYLGQRLAQKAALLAA
ncbi:NAD(P)H:quinone oxidoreductase [Rubrobacter indicoceani]|uniref:NAD(P)H:quinone oxidoreductase n=1 Tax=Rubrobacter indicoceani TaxID=2051957 RepID=UPI000E5A5FF3|nr:NAD(P)H:quinone oxidoreductase [Rubrobacter indicoceani]